MEQRLSISALLSPLDSMCSGGVIRREREASIFGCRGHGFQTAVSSSVFPDGQESEMAATRPPAAQSLARWSLLQYKSGTRLGLHSSFSYPRTTNTLC